ncbi:SDR family NAD(P)-dependent oxidoreductase [Streptomyces sp. NPDC059002]|uniref:SDR family NAD(P)-dependent oxidoreductase n=1 Tax=Streptomyces sp. NPDC059002 TaxID=3346690 RepID=UPI0036922D9A
MEQSNQVALVSGAGRGIGRQIALSLAAAGHRVAVMSRSRDELERTAQLAGDDRSRILVVPGDMTDETAVDAVVRQVDEHFGPVTLLVNNAAVFTVGEAPFWEGELDSWWASFETNVRGPLVCTRAVLPGMVAAGGGRVITVSSDSGVLPYPLSSYSYAKSALVRFTETLDISLTAADTGIRAFAISPGAVHTRLTASFAAKYPDMEWTPVEHSGWLVTDLASGRYDALHGRYLSVRDDLDRMLDRLEEIEKEELLVQRMRAYDAHGAVVTDWEQST